MEGKVYLVGCGPGAPDLVTIRALNVLKNSDVVLYDRLIDPEVLEYARDAEKIYVGKKKGESSKQENINDLLYSKVMEGRTVARVKNGNPMIFGRGGEEIQFLQERGIEVEVVPGLSSATSIPPLLGIPLTKRGVSSSLSILPGYGAGGEDPSWKCVGDTGIVLMTVGNLQKVVEALLESGKSQDTLAALVSSGALEEERLILSSLSRIVELAKLVDISSPAILISGDVVEELLRVKGRRIAIFRPGREEERTRSLIENTGAISNFYKVCTVDISDNLDLERTFDSGWDTLIFLSSNGVRSAVDLVDFNQYRIVAVGNRTKAVLEEAGATDIIVPEDQSSSGIEKLLATNDWNALALRSSLAEQGIKGAKNVTAYSVKPAGVKNAVESYLDSGSEYTVLTSSGILRLIMETASDMGLKEELKKRMNGSFLITLGRKTTKSALDESLDVNFELPSPGLKHFFDEVVG